MTELRPPLCPPKRRLEGVTREKYIAMIRWHEARAEMAMGNLCCGSHNSEYHEAREAADAHWCAAALMRLYLEHLP